MAKEQCPECYQTEMKNGVCALCGYGCKILCPGCDRGLSGNTCQLCGWTKSQKESLTQKPSSSFCLRYGDLTYPFITRVAEAMTEGRKHEENLPAHEKNYMLMSVEQALERVHHVIKHVHALHHYYLHLLDTIQFDTVQSTPGMAPRTLDPDFELEDHLGHAAAGLNMLAALEAAGRMPNTYIQSEYVQNLKNNKKKDNKG